ncbi:MAG: kinase [Candidatus Magnetominusculus sp. LBB02]|nr:kinase [Candidatus Magnetominusculus sp. LBB02]
MIISRTPHRISFFGGGTDYPDYYLKHCGKVLGACVDKYCYLSVRRLPPFFDHKHRIVYSKIENVSDINTIVHPSVRETLKYFKIDYGVSIHHDGDIPARSGMGSSSAFTVGLIHSIYALQGRIVTREDLAREAIYIEQSMIGENVGSQDQSFAAHGGLNVISFLANGKIIVEPIVINPDRLVEFERSLVLVYTGISRIASEVAGDKIKNIPKNEKNLSQMKDMVDEAYDILVNEGRDLKEFGCLMNESWLLKKTLSNKVSNPVIDALYERAMKHGAIGGKLLGAGGGGFMVFFVEQERQHDFKQALNDYLNVPFTFDFDGSKIIVYQPQRRPL